MNNHPPEELRGILLDYQAAFIQNINATHKIIVSVNNPRHVKMFKEIWSAAKIESADVLGTKKWRKIGFSVCI
jgi:hypothetical protein